MKIVSIFFLILIIIVGNVNVLSQAEVDSGETSTETITSIQLKFSLSGVPSIEDIGLTDSQSYWKFNYQLRFTDDKVLHDLQSKIYSKYEKPGDKAKWISKANKKLYKQWKKTGLFVANGNFRNTQLSLENNRDLTVPIHLSPELKELLKNLNSSAEMPNFILSVKGVVFTKMKSGKKFKKKYAKVIEFPMKFYKNADEFLLYNTFGIAITMTKENEIIFFDVSRR